MRSVEYFPEQPAEGAAVVAGARRLWDTASVSGSRISNGGMDPTSPGLSVSGTVPEAGGACLLDEEAVSG
jgi:hypothetical protein